MKEQKGAEVVNYDYNDSICRQVSNREPQLQKFSKEHDVIVFVSGKKAPTEKLYIPYVKPKTRKAISWKTNLNWIPTGLKQPILWEYAEQPRLQCGLWKMWPPL